VPYACPCALGFPGICYLPRRRTPRRLVDLPLMRGRQLAGTVQDVWKLQRWSAVCTNQLATVVIGNTAPQSSQERGGWVRYGGHDKRPGAKINAAVGALGEQLAMVVFGPTQATAIRSRRSRRISMTCPGRLLDRASTTKAKVVKTPQSRRRVSVALTSGIPFAGCLVRRSILVCGVRATRANIAAPWRRRAPIQILWD
jgi:hypothetical protein